MTQPELNDHFRPLDHDVPDGVYRVVGRDDETITLLRVADADGKRAHTGELVTVPRGEFEQFEPAANPDGNRPLRDVLATNLAMVYWSGRAFVQQLLRNVPPTTVAVTLLLIGLVGDRLLPLPDVAFGVLVVLGSVALAYIGGGRW